MGLGEASHRGRGAILRIAGAQAILIGGFALFMGLGFFRLAGLIYGGAALVVLGSLATFVGIRRRRADARHPS